jgi:hypothetical protein
MRNAGGLTNQQQIAWSFAAPVLSDSMALLFTLSVAGDVNGDAVVTCADVRSGAGGVRTPPRPARIQRRR